MYIDIDSKEIEGVSDVDLHADIDEYEVVISVDVYKPTKSWGKAWAVAQKQHRLRKYRPQTWFKKVENHSSQLWIRV